MLNLTSAAASLVLLTKVIFLFVTTSMALFISWQSSDNIDLHKADNIIRIIRITDEFTPSKMLRVTLRYVTLREVKFCCDICLALVKKDQQLVAFCFVFYGFWDTAVMFACLKIIGCKLRIHKKSPYLNPLISFFWGAENKSHTAMRNPHLNNNSTSLSSLKECRKTKTKVTSLAIQSTLNGPIKTRSQCR